MEFFHLQSSRIPLIPCWREEVGKKNCKSGNSWAHSTIANPHISQVSQSANHKSANFMIYLQIANLQISTKYCTTLSQNNPKIRLFNRFSSMYKFELEQYSICYICEDKQYVIVDLRKFTSPNHKKIGSANRKSAKCRTCGRSANLTNFLSPQICGFAICGTYLRTLLESKEKLTCFPWAPTGRI